MAAVLKQLVTDELWAVIELLLADEAPKPKGGRPRPRINDRATLIAILLVLKTGIPWQMIPQGTGCSSGMTCWRRLCGWHEAGVWEQVREALLDRLGGANRVDRSRASLVSVSVPTPGKHKTGPTRRAAATGL